MNHQKEIGDRYRYPGTRSFSDLEHDQGLFFGRELEAEELFEGIRRFPLTVLSGKSGLGKTSLLQASIYPRLRREGCAILTIRLEVDDGRPIVDLLTANFEGDCRAQKVDLHEGSRNSLWDYFQTCGIFRGVELLLPVLVLDQFEELFTVLGRPRQREVLMQLGPLINRKPPRQFETELLDHAKRWGTTKPAMAAGLGHDIEEQPTDPDDSACSNWEGGWGTVEASAEVQPPDISLVIGIRHEFIGLLKSFGEHLQGIDSNMMILRPLTYEQARQAIEKPAAFQGQPGQFAIPLSPTAKPKSNGSWNSLRFPINNAPLSSKISSATVPGRNTPRSSLSNCRSSVRRSRSGCGKSIVAIPACRSLSRPPHWAG